MARYKKKDYLAVVELLEQVNNRLAQQNLCSGDLPAVLSDCQEAAILLGTNLEQQGEEGVRLTHILEAYCESLYQLSGKLAAGAASEVCVADIQTIDCQLAELKEGIRESLPERKEVVFLPYKASMWDSLESVWMAADKDPDCDAYVIPIPYYDKKPDGSFGEFQYEGDLYPDYVPITDYREYDLEERHPDVVFIHNPYDNYNTVTSIDPNYYSDRVKQFTRCLVYVPYYATSGNMSEGQALCAAYLHADYIVTQSEKYRRFFDKRIPYQKFLPLGSPKFDSVIKKCQNPPEPPAEWKNKMQGKTVYFYNTSLTGMLQDTESFFRKMDYVFRTFQGREDACLIWRPHPLFESTIDSMRKQYRPLYDLLKKRFIEEEIGIYDTTSDMENTIAWSDVYVGDDASSVVSLFGVAGKPLFILNNRLHRKPEGNDWRGTVYAVPRGDRQNRYCILPGNRLFYSPNDDLRYQYFCDLSDFASGGYYRGAIEYNGNVYVLPANAQDILVIDGKRKLRKIALRRETERQGAFCGYWYWEDKVYLLPNRYSALAVFDLKSENITYVEGVSDFYVGEIDNERVCGAKWIWRNKLYFLNPGGNRLLSVDIDTLEQEIQEVSFGRLLTGIGAKCPDDEILWMIPYEGSVITRWNPVTGEMKDYDVRVAGMKAVHRRDKSECEINMLGSLGFCGDRLIIAPNWGNKFVELNVTTGAVEEWISPFEICMEDKNEYCPNWGMGYFIRDREDGSYRYFYSPERKTYDIDLKTKEIKEVEITFQQEDVFAHTPGFCKWSEWIQYICSESVFNSLEDLLDNQIHGDPYDRERQLEAFKAINASPDGNCGERVYQTIMEKMND